MAIESIATWWTSDRCRAAIGILGRHGALDAACLADLASEFGRPITLDAVQKGLRRHGLGPPSTHLAKPKSHTNRVSTSLESIIFFGDIHAPHHSESAVSLGIKVEEEIGPDYVVVMGDGVDCHSISDHDKDPRRVRFLREEAESFVEILERIAAASPTAKRRVMIEGNHEHRLTRYLQRRAPELDGITTMRELLRLDEIGFEWVPYRSSTTIGKLNITHETGNAGAYAHHKAMDAFASNAVIGHTHRLSVAYGGSIAGETHVGIMCGWLGDMGAIDYLHKVAARGWQHGVVIGYMEPNGTVHCQAIPFINNKCVVNGKLIG